MVSNFGGINKQTQAYTPINLANKSEKYICPDCSKDLIPHLGKIKAHHFQHKSSKNNPCNYYSKSPSESQKHKNSKYQLKYIWENNDITIKRYCKSCQTDREFKISQKVENTEIVIEHPFTFNNSKKYADLAYLKNGNNNPSVIIEILVTSKTKIENRPEPWYEIDAAEICECDSNKYQFRCVRDMKCEKCLDMDKLKENDLEKYVRIKLGQDYTSPEYVDLSSNDGPCLVEINQDEYNQLTVEKQGIIRPKHLRLDFNAIGNDKDFQIGIENNKKICEIFDNDLHFNKIIIHSRKGGIWGYIVSNKDYIKHKDEYWRQYYDGINGELQLPYVYKANFSGETTVDIIKKLILESKKHRPSNNCKFPKGLCEDCGSTHKNRKWNKCKDCIKKICFDCGTTKKNIRYMRCYDCHINK